MGRDRRLFFPILDFFFKFLLSPADGMGRHPVIAQGEKIFFQLPRRGGNKTILGNRVPSMARPSNRQTDVKERKKGPAFALYGYTR
uniref:Uncharacterized protein n=1 Tax=Daphnia magna TaxID=35525 RepID=A0A0P5BXF0_9CRUS